MASSSGATLMTDGPIWIRILVFAIPILCMGLRIFPRITRRSLLYTLIGFTIYFLFAFISGTILNGYASVTKERVNFFFMFDKSQAFEYFPMFSFAGETRIAFGRFEIYPILVGIIYFGFLLLCFLFYLLVKKVLYKMEDDHLQLRLSAIELYEKTTGKPSRRPKEFID